MLSRGGGAIAFQKVVSKVSDLPSPLDAESGQRIIVRETEEVYGLNATTRMWEVIGTLKRVGGKKPEELAAHIDSKGNPHGTSLQDVLDVGTTVKISQEIVLSGKGPASQIRLMSGSAALRVGPDAGSKDGALWLNVGAGKKTILRAVNSDGDDMLVLSTDGIVSGGSATFYGGFKGLATFEDEIIAKEGVQSADGHDLLLGGDKAVALNVGGRTRAYLNDSRLNLSVGLGVKGDIHLEGAVRSNLNPAPSLKDLTLGVPLAPWKSVAAGHVDAKTIALQVPANSKVDPLKVSGAVPGDTAVLTSGGALGLGTDAPKARLDVRGEALIDSGLRLTKNSIKSGDWATIFGAELVIVHKGTVLLRGQADGTTVLGATKVQGSLLVTGKLALGGVSGLQGQEIKFSGPATSYSAAVHKFTGAIEVDADASQPLKVPGFAVADGNVVVDGAVYADSVALANGLSVGGAILTGKRLSSPDDFELDVATLVTKKLSLTGGEISSSELKLAGHGGSATFSMVGPNCGLSFKGKRWELDGITKLSTDEAYVKQLNVEGGASFCAGQATINAQGLHLAGELNVGGLAFKKVVEEVKLDGLSASTRFELPAGVRIEAVLVRLKTDVTGARFLQVGDLSDPDRFASPSTNLKAGSLIRGLNHWNQGRVVQKTKAPVVISGDAAATGRLVVTIHYVDPAAL
jgi:hypothetical protein